MHLAALAGLLLLATVTAMDSSSQDDLEDELNDLDDEQVYDEEEDDYLSAETIDEQPTYMRVLLRDASFEADEELMDAVREIGSITSTCCLT